MHPASGEPKVLVVSKRLPELCATKALLNSYGFEVATVTNERTAQAVARAVPYRAAIICFHSLNAAERDHIAASLNDSNPQLEVVRRCPGCTGCDEQAGAIGKLPGDEWLADVVMGHR